MNLSIFPLGLVLAAGLVLLLAGCAAALFPPGSVVAMIPSDDINPAEWLIANGFMLPVSGNIELYSLFGNKFGGDRINSFAVPDLRARFILSSNPGGENGLTQRVTGIQGGVESLQLTVPHLPQHTHRLRKSSVPAVTSLPATTVSLGGTPLLYTSKNDSSPSATFSMNSIGPSGGNLAINLMWPHTAVAYYICVNQTGCSKGKIPTGMILAFTGNFNQSGPLAQAGWVEANGQSLDAQMYQHLSNISLPLFASDNITVTVPNLSGRAPLGHNPSQGAPGLTQNDLNRIDGFNETFIQISNLPAHNHALRGYFGSTNASGTSLVAVSSKFTYGPGPPTVFFASSIDSVGNPTPNPVSLMAPYGVVTFIICVVDGGCGTRIPTGVVISGASAESELLGPSWMIPDGSSLDSATYAELANISVFPWENSTHFILPDFRGRHMVGRNESGGYFVGHTGGQEFASLSLDQLPSHTHSLTASTAAATMFAAKDNVYSVTAQNCYAADANPAVEMDESTIVPVGNGKPFSLMKPYLVLEQMLCVDDIGCKYSCTPCGCVPPLLGVDCLELESTGNFTWTSIKSARSKPASIVALTSKVVALQDVTLAQNTTILYFEGVSKLEITGCLSVLPGSILLLEMSNDTVTDIKGQLMVSANSTVVVPLAVQQGCLNGNFASIHLQGPNQIGSASACHSMTTGDRGGFLSLVFQPTRDPDIEGCVIPEPPLVYIESSPPTQKEITTEHVNVAMVASVSTVAGLLFIALVLIVFVPPIRKKFLPMLHYKLTQESQMSAKLEMNQHN